MVKADIEADHLTLKQSDSRKHLIYWVICSLLSGSQIDQTIFISRNKYEATAQSCLA